MAEVQLGLASAMKVLAAAQPTFEPHQPYRPELSSQPVVAVRVVQSVEPAALAEAFRV
jgi:hypothetical protein